MKHNDKAVINKVPFSFKLKSVIKKILLKISPIYRKVNNIQLQLENIQKVMPPHHSFKSADDVKKYITDEFPDYHIDIIHSLHKEFNLSGKKILDVGGSNVSVEFMRELGVKQFVCLDPVTKWSGFHSAKKLPTTKYGKVIYQKDMITQPLLDEYCFIIDIDIEDELDALNNYFDVIISISTFEHVTDIKKCMNTIYKYLHTGGVCHSQYEPIFSSPVGHHMYVNKEINFCLLRELDNIHLLYTKDQAREIIKNELNVSEDILDKILFQIYDSDVINRKTFNEHILEIMNSHFNKYTIEYFFRTPSELNILSELIKKYGFMRFDVRGIKLRCIKD